MVKPFFAHIEPRNQSVQFLKIAVTWLRPVGFNLRLMTVARLSILKFFLHLTKEEQRKRFLERIDEPAKNWKFSLADIEERKFWKDYMKAYQECFSATSTSDSPWYMAPVDDKRMPVCAARGTSGRTHA